MEILWKQRSAADWVFCHFIYGFLSFSVSMVVFSKLALNIQMKRTGDENRGYTYQSDSPIQYKVLIIASITFGVFAGVIGLWLICYPMIQWIF